MLLGLAASRALLLRAAAPVHPFKQVMLHVATLGRHYPHSPAYSRKTPSTRAQSKIKDTGEEFEAAIQRSFYTLRDMRAALPSKIHGQLVRDALLRRHSVVSLKKMGGTDYLVALDFTTAWSQS